MQITFTCPNCQTNLEIPAENMGKDIECPSCTVVTSIPRQEPGPGTTIGGFYIKSLIGVGGMGNVFLATQLSMDRDIALKVLSAAVTRDPEDLERFMHEVRMTAKLEHPNIVSAYEAGEDNAYYYMAMAYVNGLPLDRRIQNSDHHRLEEKDALRITKKIASALSYAWNEYGMLHRDVKPENILLDTYGEPKLADFGLSRTHQQAKKVTSHGTIMGTPNYMSPEQMDDLSNADKRSDIYSLGATLYQMLTGQIPFEGSNVLKTFQLIATESLDDPRKYNPKISLQCIKLLEKMLARDPGDRYQTWNDVLADITLALSNKQITTPRLSEGESVIDTITISAKKTNVTPRKPTAPAPSGTKLGIIITTVIIILGVGLIKIADVQKEKKTKRQQQATINAQLEIATEKKAILRKRYNDIVQYIADNPDNYSGCFIKLKQALKSNLAGTIYENKIQQQLNSIIAEHNNKINVVWNTLRQQAQKLFDAGQVNKAIQLLRSYTGEYEIEIKEKRDALATTLEKKIQDQIVSTNTNDEKSCEAIGIALDSLADALIAMDFKSATTIIAETDSSYFPAKSVAKWRKIKYNIHDVSNSQRIIAASFQADIGKDIYVSLKVGKLPKLRITSISADTIYARSIAAGREYKFSINKISEIEYFKRLGSRESAGLNIMRGVLSYNAGSQVSANKYFANANCPLSSVLAEKIKILAAEKIADQKQPKVNIFEQSAEENYLKLLVLLKLEHTKDDPWQTITFLESAQYGTATLHRLSQMLNRYNSEYKYSKFAMKNIDVLKAMGKLCAK